MGNYEFEISYPEVLNLSDKQVADKIKNIIEERFSLKDESIGTEGEDEEDFKQTLTVTYEITQKSNDILSIKILSSNFMEGAAHPSNYLDGITFDMKTGELITLEHLFKEDGNYISALNEILNKKVDELEFKLFDEYKGIEEEQGYYLTDSRIVIFYQEGEYTPYAAGALLLEVEFEEINDILK
ncbi:hypothetical protein SH2C18_20760 [Clostridium sediminicola]|uniref:DUF3298 and DUF4163 domain-containing protein n=1 Tax=Clostridium sediminicola TaxID=3114879 RepID=UPI0031F2346E